MWQLNGWEALLLQLPYSYNPLYYFCMGIIEYISFFIFDVKDPTLNQKLCAQMMRKLKIKVLGMRRKNIKISIRHSQKNLRHYVDSFLEAYLGPSWTFMMELFCVIFVKVLYRRCSTGFWMRLWFLPAIILFL